MIERYSVLIRLVLELELFFFFFDVRNIDSRDLLQLFKRIIRICDTWHVQKNEINFVFKWLFSFRVCLIIYLKYQNLMFFFILFTFFDVCIISTKQIFDMIIMFDIVHALLWVSIVSKSLSQNVVIFESRFWAINANLLDVKWSLL